MSLQTTGGSPEPTAVNKEISIFIPGMAALWMELIFITIQAIGIPLMEHPVPLKY